MSGTVGLGFGAYQPTFKVARRPKNPLDKCTIVSVYPQVIIDYKPTAFPQTHRIEAAPDNDYSLSVVEGAGWYKEMEDGMPFLEIPIPSTEVARAFIQDFVTPLPEAVPGVAGPGLFFVLGSHDKKSIQNYTDEAGKTFKELLESARVRQKTWFSRLVSMTDSDWARTNGNPKAVSELARLAAEKIGIKDKPWMANITALERSACPACGQFINLNFPVCPNCKTVVDSEKFTKLGLKFAS